MLVDMTLIEAIGAAALDCPDLAHHLPVSKTLESEFLL